MAANENAEHDEHVENFGELVDRIFAMTCESEANNEQNVISCSSRDGCFHVFMAPMYVRYTAAQFVAEMLAAAPPYTRIAMLCASQFVCYGVVNYVKEQLNEMGLLRHDKIIKRNKEVITIGPKYNTAQSYVAHKDHIRGLNAKTLVVFDISNPAWGEIDFKVMKKLLLVFIRNKNARMTWFADSMERYERVRAEFAPLFRED